MIHTILLKKLAISIVENGIDAKTSSFLLTKLNKTQLKIFLTYYKKALAKKSVIVTTADTISLEVQNSLKKQFDDKMIILNTDPKVGGGIKMQLDDTIIDFTVKKYINDTIDQLEQ